MKAMILLAAAVLSGCVTAPHRIQPQFVGESSYRSMSCEDIDREIATRDQRLATLSSQQQHSATMDAVWFSVGTFLIWPAYFGMLGTEDYKDEIARLKGENVALVNVKVANCTAAGPTNQARDALSTGQLWCGNAIVSLPCDPSNFRDADRLIERLNDGRWIACTTQDIRRREGRLQCADSEVPIESVTALFGSDAQ